MLIAGPFGGELRFSAAVGAPHRVLQTRLGGRHLRRFFTISLWPYRNTRLDFLVDMRDVCGSARHVGIKGAATITSSAFGAVSIGASASGKSTARFGELRDRVPHTSRRLQRRQRSIPRSSRRRLPQAPARTRESPQAKGLEALLPRGIPAHPRSGPKRHDRPVTPEVAGSSPIGPGTASMRAIRGSERGRGIDSSCQSGQHGRKA